MSRTGSKNLSFARRSQKAAIAAVSLAEPAEFSADIAVSRVVCVADRRRQAVALLSQVRFLPVVPRGALVKSAETDHLLPDRYRIDHPNYSWKIGAIRRQERFQRDRRLV